jgi:hypothetical protein
MNYDATLPLVSIHIPKTGGSSFLLILREWFGQGHVHVHFPGEGLTHIPDELSGRDCVHGHFNAARGCGIDEVVPRGRQFITLLRDPFERFVSQWAFIHRNVRGADECLNDESLDHFRQWLGLRAAEQKTGRNSHSLVWHFPRRVRECPTVTEIERHFVFIGDTKRYEASVTALASLLQKPVPTVPFVNAWLRDKTVFEPWRSEYEEAFADEIDLYRAGLDFATRFPGLESVDTPSQGSPASSNLAAA